MLSKSLTHKRTTLPPAVKHYNKLHTHTRGFRAPCTYTASDVVVVVFVVVVLIVICVVVVVVFVVVVLVVVCVVVVVVVVFVVVVLETNAHQETCEDTGDDCKPRYFRRRRRGMRDKIPL